MKTLTKKQQLTNDIAKAVINETDIDRLEADIVKAAINLGYTMNKKTIKMINEIFVEVVETL